MAENANGIQGVNGPADESISDRFANHALIDAALNRAAREAVLDHARAGNPVCTMRDGKVVWVQPDEVFALIAEMDKQKNGNVKPT